MCTQRMLCLHVMFNMLNPSLKAVVLACCHFWAPHWGAEAAHASVSQCISLLTPPHTRMYLAHTMLKLQRHSHGGGGLKENTHESAPTQLPIWPWSGGLIQQWQILQDPWGRRKDRWRTKGNDSIWPGHMALKGSSEDRLRLDLNPQQETKWMVLPVTSSCLNGFDNIISNLAATEMTDLLDCLKNACM